MSSWWAAAGTQRSRWGFMGAPVAAVLGLARRRLRSCQVPAAAGGALVGGGVAVADAGADARERVVGVGPGRIGDLAVALGDLRGLGSAALASVAHDAAPWTVCGVPRLRRTPRRAG